MLQEQAKLMLAILTKDKKAFKKFYKKGYFSYSKDKEFQGKVAIVNNAVISLLEDAYDKSRVVATVNFKDSGALFYKVFGNNYSFNQFGQDPTRLIDTTRVCHRKREDVIRDITTIRIHCAEAEEKASAIQKASDIVSKFNTILIKSNNKVSSQDAFLLLQDTLVKLSQTRQLKEIEQSSNLDTSR